jgi:glycosyltransferase involved in cell wall biosynthesis
MRVAMVTEDGYPFVRNDTASWVHLLISSLPHIEFELITIMPRQFTNTQYTYALPQNVSSVWVYKLGQKPRESAKKINISKHDQAALADWLKFQHASGQALRILGNRIRSGAIDSFLQSKFFRRTVQQAYKEEAQPSSFPDYLSLYQDLSKNIMSLLRQLFPNVDLVHAASAGYAGLVAAYIKEQQAVPFILTERSIYAREKEQEILEEASIPEIHKERYIRYFHHLSKQAYESATDVISLWEQNKIYQSKLGVPSHKLSIISDGIDAARYSGIRYTKTSQTLQIGAFIDDMSAKQIQTILYAAKQLAHHGADFQLWLPEEARHRKECFLSIMQFRLQTYISFYSQSRMTEDISSFDLLLSTGKAKGQFTVLKGMAAGVPWIVTDTEAYSDLIFGSEGDEWGQAGLIIPAGDAEELAKACKWVYEHREEAALFGQNGKRRVQNEYQWEYIVHMYQTLYEERIKESGRYWVQ